MVSSYKSIAGMRIFGNMSSFLVIKVFLTMLLMPVTNGRFIDDRNLLASSEEPNVELTIDEMISLASLLNTNTNGPDDKQQFDMILTKDQYEALHPGTTGNRQKRKANSYLSMRWTDNQVWYRRQPGAFSEDQWNKILYAMRDFEEKTCLTFHEDVDQSHHNHVYIVTGQGCSSYVGMLGGAQTMTLGDSYCFTHGVILHEIGHTIGFFHEHQRPDRDDYIEILRENIVPEYRPWFNSNPPHWVNYYSVPYDYLSVMHYGGYAASQNGSPTIRTKDRSKQYLIGHRRSLSFHDLQLVNRMYECDVKCDQTVKCPPNAYRGKDCQCYCEVNSKIQLCTGAKPTPPVTEKPVTKPPVTKLPVTKTSTCDDLHGACTAWVTSLPNLCVTNPDVIRLCPKSCNHCHVTSGKTTTMSSTSKSKTTSTPTSASTSSNTPTRTPSSTITSTNIKKSTIKPTSTSTPTSTPKSTSTRTSTNTEPSTSTPKTSNKPITSHTTIPTPGTTETPCTDYSRACVHWARVPGLCHRDFNVRRLCKKSCGSCDV